jgi:hypothetical protein
VRVLCCLNAASTHTRWSGQRLGLRKRLRETEAIDAWSKIVGDFIATHSAPVALREGVLYVRGLQPALHYELDQVSKLDILRKLKQCFGGRPSATSALESGDLGACEITVQKQDESPD